MLRITLSQRTIAAQSMCGGSSEAAGSERGWRRYSCGFVLLV